MKRAPVLIAILIALVGGSIMFSFADEMPIGKTKSPKPEILVGCAFKKLSSGQVVIHLLIKNNSGMAIDFVQANGFDGAVVISDGSSKAIFVTPFKRRVMRRGYLAVQPTTRLPPNGKVEYDLSLNKDLVCYNDRNGQSMEGFLEDRSNRKLMLDFMFNGEMRSAGIDLWELYRQALLK